MTLIKRLFPLFFLVLSFCGEVEDKNKGLPDGNDKGLSNYEKGRTVTVMGALGDLQFLVNEVGNRQTNSNIEVLIPLSVDRYKQRRDLQKSLDLDRCLVRDQGSFDTAKFSLEFSGNQCPAHMSYFQKRRILTDTNTSKVELMDFGNTFDVRLSGVDSDLKNFEMQGEYRRIFEKKPESSRWRYEVDMELSGLSKEAGTFEYTLEERWIDSQINGEALLRIVQRTDRIKFGRKFRGTLYKVERYIDDRLQGQSFRVNGDDIPEADYLELMQDLHNQWGVERFESF